MANPSLQIGNSKWAIKKDNLLGYSTAGTRFLPIPITMTRASAGTRVNAQGLVETVELLGSEQVVNGNFATDSDWTKSGGVTISDGKANINGDGTSFAAITQANVFTVGKIYKVTADVIITSGLGLKFQDGANNENIGFATTTGFYTFYFTATSNTSIVIGRRTGGTAFNSSIDNVSVKESTRNDLARVDYTGSTSSLLAEPQRTNLVTYSSDFSDSSYVKSGVTVISDYATSPDGTLNASKLTFTSTGEILQSMSFVVGEQYTFSFYAKTETGTFDFTLGNMAYYLESATATTEWQRFTVTQSAVATTRYPKIDASTSGDLLVWGWQIEEGSYATSYIPTSGSTVTRVQDQYTKTGISDKINSEEGVLFVEIENITGTDAPNKMISITDGSLTNKISIFVSSNRINVESAGSGTNFAIYSKALQSGFNKIAVKYKVNDCAMWVNGTEYTDTSFAAFSSNTFNTLLFDRGDGLQDFYGKVKQLQLYKTALTDTQLAALTS